MNRSILTLLIFVLILLPASLPAQDFDNVEINVIPVTDDIYMLTGRGGNIGLSTGPDGAFLIDDQYAPLTDRILAAVATVTDQPVKFVLNTHWHGDHTGGNENLTGAGALIVAHDNVRRRLSEDQFLSFFDAEVAAAPDAALPVVTFSETLTFHFNGHTLHAFHVPGAHTDGDSAVHFVEANVVHTGDLVFNGLFPFIDLDSGGSVNGMIAAAERLLEVTDAETRIIPGHGPLMDRDELAAYHRLLVTVRDRVAELVAEGMSLEEVQAAGPTAEFDEAWGGGFIPPDRWVEILYRDLSR